jgi:NhaA family Na+:H+ antiporter
VTIIGLAAGIGFTMAIFIAELAFPGSPYLGLAKLAILIATAAAAIGALLLGRFTLPPQVADPFAARLSPADAEASTEF